MFVFPKQNNHWGFSVSYSNQLLFLHLATHFTCSGLPRNPALCSGWKKRGRIRIHVALCSFSDNAQGRICNYAPRWLVVFVLEGRSWWLQRSINGYRPQPKAQSFPCDSWLQLAPEDWIAIWDLNSPYPPECAFSCGLFHRIVLYRPHNTIWGEGRIGHSRISRERGTGYSWGCT